MIDVETAIGPDGHRIIAFGAVTVRHDNLGGKWGDFVNPGIPIDARTMETHHLDDARIKHFEDFAALAPRVLATLTPLPGETLVLCAHNTNFDVPVVKREIERVGLVMPDLPLLDTMRGLTRLAGVRPKSAKLGALLEKLHIDIVREHDALGDAWVTAEAARQMLDLVAMAGFDDLGRLLAEANDGTATSVAYAAPRSGPGRARRPAAPERSDAHIASHSGILEADPSADALTDWTNLVAQCASLRCDLLVDRVAAAGAPPDVLLPPLLALLEARAAASDAAGAATIVAAVMPLLALAPATFRGPRRAAVELDERLGLLLDPLGRCRRADYCPSCRVGEPCPLDMWRLALAVAAMNGPLEKMARQFFMVNTNRRTQPYETIRARGHPELADAALRLVHRHWLATGYGDVADQLADNAWNVGCRDPEIAEAHAMALAAGGREQDLQDAAAVCAAVLPLRAGNTDEAWRLLEIRGAQIDGQIERRRVRFSDQVDEDGNPIPLRRHHPANPRRVRAPRFLRTTRPG